MIDTDVLVVGAGPTGLAAANELARLGVRVHLVDKNEAPSPTSRALGVHAGTLEALEESFGVEFSRKLVAAGHQVRAAHFDVYGQLGVPLNLSLIPSRYNFVLILPQSATEKFLEDNLRENFSLSVRRSTEMVSFKQERKKVLTILRDKSGRELEVRSDFVIGADGAHSTTRHLLDIPFKGDTYPNDFMLGDVELEWPWSYGDIRTFLAEDGIVAAFPLNSVGTYRLVIAQPRAPVTNEASLNRKQFEAGLEGVCPGKIKIKTAVWLSRFRVHHRVVDRMYEGRIFVAGDAAHIHSPVGGQGMNTGIQDALNLSFKMALILRHGASESLLKDYERERLPVARNVLRATHFLTRFGLSDHQLFARVVKSLAVPLMTRNDWLQRRIVRNLSQVSIARKEMAGRARQGLPVHESSG